MSDIVCIQTYPNRHDAEFAQSILKSGGVNAVVSADDAGGTHPELPFTRGVRLLIAARDVELARELLAPVEKDTTPRA
jgi:hypothetical protein